MEALLPPFDPLLAGWRERRFDGLIGLVGPLWCRRGETGWEYGIQSGVEHSNPAGVVHGGLLATLMDHALSLIAWEAAGRVSCVTVQLDCQFVATVQPGCFIFARGRVVRQSSILVFMQGSLMVGDQEVVTGNAVLKVVRTAGR